MPRAGARVIRIPGTPAELLAAAEAMSRLRDAWEQRGEQWFSLDEELAYLEHARAADDD
jgi:hypothetical protein